MASLQSENGQIEESGTLPATVSDLPAADYHATVIYHGRTMQKSFLVQPNFTNDVPFEFELGAVHLETVPNGTEVHTADGNYLGQTPLLLPDMTPQTAQFTLSLSGYEPVSVILDIVADQTNSYRTNLVGVGYLFAMREARTYLERSDFEAAAQAATAALNAKTGDEDALAIQNEAESRLEAKRQNEERLLRPKKWFDNLCSEYPDANLFAEHELKTSKHASEIALGIVAALTNSPNAFRIIQVSSPETDAYEIVAQQIFSLGILGGNEKDCLIVVGQAADDETQIRFKILDFQIQHSVINFQDEKRLVPLNPSRIRINGFLQAQIQEGTRIITKRINSALQN